MTAPVDVTNMKIETERVILRAVQKEDAADLHLILSDQDVSDLAGFPLCRTFEESQKRVDRCLEKKNSLAIVGKDDRKVIGILSIEDRPWEEYPMDQELKGRELGFFLRKDCWGRGLMPEAVMAVMDYCFEKLGYDFLTCGHFADNSQSRRVIEKCGFSHLFDALRQLPHGKEFDISAYICYNTGKES